MLPKILLLCVFMFCSTNVEPAKILGIFPMPSISHQVVFRALTMELAKRGHELVILTPNPAFPGQQAPLNITEIDTGETYAVWAQLLQDGRSEKKLQRGVIMDFNSMFDDKNARNFMDIIVRQFKYPQVKALIEDKSKKFDLIITEAFMNYVLIAGKIFDAPIIQMSSYYGSSENFDAIGAPAWHPLYFPSSYRRKYRDLSLWEKIQESYQEYTIMKFIKKGENFEYELLKKNFGPDVPSINELQKQVHMLFLNAHPIFGNNRPVPPNTVYFGALHLQPVKDLPKELKSYLDSSKRGVIYVSLGTNVSPSKMDKDFLEAFLKAFEALPYDILWKFDGDNLDGVPKNVKIQKWFPQRDLLMHPNIKLFIMQGGLQSTDEAIDAGVPLVGIPILGDQWYNVNKYVELGVGVEVDAVTMVADDLIKAANEVLSNNSYRENMKKLREIINDQPMKPLDHAVWWVEYVIRHGGARHLKPPSANKTWAEYYMLDILVILGSGVILIVVSVVVVILKLLNVLKRRSVKRKTN